MSVLSRHSELWRVSVLYFHSSELRLVMHCIFALQHQTLLFSVQIKSNYQTMLIAVVCLHLETDGRNRGTWLLAITNHLWNVKTKCCIELSSTYSSREVLLPAYSSREVLHWASACRLSLHKAWCHSDPCQNVSLNVLAHHLVLWTGWLPSFPDGLELNSERYSILFYNLV